MNIELRDELRKVYHNMRELLDKTDDVKSVERDVQKLMVKLMLKTDLALFLKDNKLTTTDIPFDVIEEFNDIYVRVYLDSKFFNQYRYFDLEQDYLFYAKDKYLKAMDRDVKYDFLERWEYSPEARKVVVTHANCSDGYGTAGVVKFHAEHIIQNDHEIEYIFLDYNKYDFEELKEKLTGKLVYVGDFSFAKDELDELKTITDNIIVVDHHLKVFDSEVANDPHVHVDMSLSGTRLAWDFFLPTMGTMLIVELISDRDIWNFHYGNYSKALDLFVNEAGREIIWKYIDLNMQDDLIEILDEYELRIERKLVKDTKRANEVIEYNIHGVTVVGMNLTSSVSEVLNIASETYNKPAMGYWIDNKSNTLQLSFRDATDRYNVSEIASIFGGGGHKAAAGANIPIEQVQLEEFFIEKKVAIKYYDVDLKCKVTLLDKHNIKDILEKYDIYVRQEDKVICLKDK